MQRREEREERTVVKSPLWELRQHFIHRLSSRQRTQVLFTTSGLRADLSLLQPLSTQPCTLEPISEQCEHKCNNRCGTEMQDCYQQQAGITGKHFLWPRPKCSASKGRPEKCENGTDKYNRSSQCGAMPRTETTELRCHKTKISGQEKRNSDTDCRRGSEYNFHEKAGTFYQERQNNWKIFAAKYSHLASERTH